MIRPNVKPALMVTIEAEFGKNPQDPSFVANRKVSGAKVESQGQEGGVMEVCEESGEAAAPAFNPDDILPRKDISQPVNDRIVPRLNDANWKERKAAMDDIEQLLVESGNRIQPTVGDLFPALKGRLSDANKNLIAQALKIFSKLAAAMGKAIERQGKGILEPALSALSDAKPVVRAAVIELMEAWCSVASLNSLLPEFIGAVASPKSHIDGKKDALVWLNKMATEGRVTKDSLENCVKACGAGLSDKAGQVREASHTLLQSLTTKFGDSVTSCVQSTDASYRSALQEAVQKIRGDAQATVTSTTAGQSTPDKGRKGARTPEVSTTGSTTRVRKGSRNVSGDKTPPMTAKTEAPPLFVFNDRKADRAHRNRGKRGKFDGVPPDEESVLKTDMEPCVAPHLHSLLFAPDFKKHCTAAELIKDAINDLYNEILSSLDFLFRSHRSCCLSPRI